MRIPLYTCSTLRCRIQPQFAREPALGHGQRRRRHQSHRHLPSTGGLRPLRRGRRRSGSEGQVLRHPQRLARDGGTYKEPAYNHLILGVGPPARQVQHCDPNITYHLDRTGLQRADAHARRDACPQ